jgi:hypothetical protein
MGKSVCLQVHKHELTAWVAAHFSFIASRFESGGWDMDYLHLLVVGKEPSRA